MPYKKLLYEKSAEGIATITLHRPEKLNALDMGLLQDIRDVLDEIQADDEVRVVVVTGSGRAFSAGFDLGLKARLRKRIHGPIRATLDP